MRGPIANTMNALPTHPLPASTRTVAGLRTDIGAPHRACLSADDLAIQRVQRGDRGAYLELFDRYYPRVESYARWRLRDHDAASDMASETFLRAYRSIGGYRTGSGSAYLAYLLQICRRLIGAEMTRGGADKGRSLEQLAEESQRVADSSEMPLLCLLEEERRTMIRAALERLAPDDREIVHLAFERDLSRRDIARIMGKPTVSAVTSHLYRAMQKLRAVVAEQGYFGGADCAVFEHGSGKAETADIAERR